MHWVRLGTLRQERKRRFSQFQQRADNGMKLFRNRAVTTWGRKTDVKKKQVSFSHTAAL